MRRHKEVVGVYPERLVMKDMRSMHSLDKSTRRRICTACGDKTLHIKLGVWMSTERCWPCRACGHLVDRGMMVQEPLSPPGKKP